MSNLEWNDVLLEQNPNVAYDRFVNKICALYDEHCPEKKVRLNRKKINKLWLTPGLINATKKKRWLFEQSFKVWNL